MFNKVALGILGIVGLWTLAVMIGIGGHLGGPEKSRIQALQGKEAKI